jgi:hypothetical protein
VKSAAPIPIGVGVLRIAVGACTIAVLGYAYALTIAAGDGSPFDYFGYFTNQTSLGMSVLLIATGVGTVARRRPPEWLSTMRGVVTAYLIIVAVVYNTLVPGTGSAPPWVSAVLHLAFPAVAVVDWMLIADRRPLPWRRLWVVLPYPLVWLGVVLARGALDGWVPYGFLLPENGVISLVLHTVGLSCAVVAAGALVWAMSRLAGHGARTR